MLSPLVSWILSPSSSSSSSDEDRSLNTNTEESNYENSNNENDNDTDYEDSVQCNENDNVITGYEENENDIVTHDVQNEQNNTVTDDHNDQNGHFLSSCNGNDNVSPAVTVAFPTSNDRDIIMAATTTATVTTAHPKRQRINQSKTLRQYQRLWSKQDEMELLKGYLDHVKQRQGTTTSLQNDVALLYDDVRPKLNMEFQKNQLVEKLRRLKRKHKMALEKVGKVSFKFKTPQEEAIFELSQMIWGNGRDKDALDCDESSPITESNGPGNVKVKTEEVDNCDELENRVSKRLRLITDNGNRRIEHKDGDTATSIHGFIEETMRSCFSPLTKEVVDNAKEGSLGGFIHNPALLHSGELDNEQWMKRRIMELEVYLNRLEVLKDQIKGKLEELRSR